MSKPGRDAVLMGIPSGLDGTRSTLRLMSAMVRQSKTDPTIRSMALQLTRFLPQKDFRREVGQIHSFVRDQIRYVRDIRKVETLQTPETTLALGQGDCDDKAVLAASMLESIGHPTRFLAVGFRPDSCSHVLAEVKIGGRGKWVALETTEPVPLGWSPPGVLKRIAIDNG